MLAARLNERPRRREPIDGIERGRIRSVVGAHRRLHVERSLRRAPLLRRPQLADAIDRVEGRHLAGIGLARIREFVHERANRKRLKDVVHGPQPSDPRVGGRIADLRGHVRHREREIKDALLQILESGLGGRAGHASNRRERLRFRHRGESVYKWELDKDNDSLAIGVNGSLILDELDLVIQAALDGAGLAWVAEDRVLEHLASGALVRVLEDWTPPFPGFFLYYPTRKQQPAALAAVIEIFRLQGGADREDRP